MKNPPPAGKYSLTVLRGAAVGPATYTLEIVAELTGVHPELLRHYCRLGLFGAGRARSTDDPIFDDDALYELRRLEAYRRDHRVDRPTLRLIAGLRREVERLQAEVRFLRGP
jgi:hypothetical protein